MLNRKLKIPIVVQPSVALQQSCFGDVSSSTSYKGATEVKCIFPKYVEKLYREN